MPRFLFGPMDDVTFTDRFLAAPCEAGRWATFSAQTPSFTQALATLDPKSPPDALLLWTGYASIPTWVWSASIPVVALAHDPHLLWHPYRHLLPLADLILTDAPAANRLHQSGLKQVRPANLCGLDRHFIAELDQPSDERDIDILFVGDLSPTSQTAWLGRLGALADRYKVVIATGVAGAEYRAILKRSKLMFNFSSHGECNRQALEAVAKGAVLLQEAENLELPAYLTSGSDYVSYTHDDFEGMVDRLLANDHERLKFIERAKERVRGYRFDALIEGAVGVDGPEWSDVRERAARRMANSPGLTLAGRLWQRVARLGPDADPMLIDDLKTANDRYSLAVLAQSPAEAEPHLAVCAARNRVAAVGWASALCDLGRAREAVETLRMVLGDLKSNPSLTPAERDTVPYPARFDYLRVGWERAGYDHSDDPQAEIQAKIAMLQSRAYSLLAAQTSELAAYAGAAAACPQLPTARAGLGCALARAGRLVEAIEHLRFAVENDPFHHPTANALVAALTESGDVIGADTVRSARRILAQAAPGLVPEIEPVNNPSTLNAVNTTPLPSPSKPCHTRFVDLAENAFAARFGSLEASAALSSFTPPQDTRAILTLVAHMRPRRVLEVGTAVGHMTANLTAITPPESIVYSIGLVTEDGIRSGVANQTSEMPKRDQFAKFLNHFGTAHKAMLITADSRSYDFTRLAPLDFAFIDGGHDFHTARSDSLGVYHALRPGGCLVWHDVPSPFPWIEVEKAISGLCFPEPVYRIAGTQVAFLLKGEGVGMTTGADSARVEMAWEGQFDIIHSLSSVNRSVCLELLARGHDIALVCGATTSGKVSGTPRELPAILAERVGRELPGAVTVRHRWPPDFTLPNRTGAFVLMQPWEYGRLPRAWIEPILSTVDEVWAYSRSIVHIYVSSGIPEERLALVPPGVDLNSFRPDRKPLPLPTTKGIKLLFLGGTIPRKGFDCLLAAYRKAFTNRDDVCLVVKEMGANTFYAGQTSGSRIEKFRADPQAPEILYLTADLQEAELVRLYAACAALVHPYRGEGFALPVLEAMACGKPVVVTAGGPTDEFVPPAAGWQIPARQSYFSEERVGELLTVGKPWWLEPDISALAEILQSVVADGGERDKRGVAARHAALGWSWMRTASIIEDRVRVLRTRTPLRLRRNSK